MGLFSFLKKNKDMITPEMAKVMRDEFSRYHHFQWVKGERVGDVVYFQDIFDDGGKTWVLFKDGSRCNMSLIDDMLIKEMTPEILDLKPQKVSAKVSPLPPEPAKKPDSPIHALLKKQRDNRVRIDISVDLNVPPPELFEVLAQSFENADEEVISYALLDLSMEKMQAAVAAAIRAHYNLEEKRHVQNGSTTK